nr:reverse transcriptase domain-containing protein [Tanacetum cinerariifolium]
MQKVKILFARLIEEFGFALHRGMSLKRRHGLLRAFATRYTDDTLQILGLHEDQRIYGFVHGLRTRNLVEHLSTNLASTYKGLMEKNYTWTEAKEKSRDKLSPYRGPNHGLLSNLSKIPREIFAMKKVAKTFKQPPRLPKSKWARDKTKYYHFQEDHRHDTNQFRELRHQIEEVVKSRQMAYLVKGIKKKKEKVSNTQLDAEEKIMVNDQYPKQTITIARQLQTKTKLKLQELLKAHTDVFAWTTAHMTRVPRTIMVGGEIFNTEHRVNDSKHVEPVKQKKRSLTPTRNEAIHTQVEELTKENILQEVKYQTWVSNPVITKKANERWKLCIDFTDINKASLKENHPLPITESKVKEIHRHRFKCFLDAYKGYHQSR